MAKKKLKREITVFLDGVDWQHEIGNASGGNLIFGSEIDLKKHSDCWDECGIVQCKLVFEKWAVMQDYSNMLKNSVNFEDLKENDEVIRLEGASKHLMYLEKLCEEQRKRVITITANLKEKKK